MYRYILRVSCSQFDSLPLTSLAAHIGCPNGEVVTKVDFASFGNPSGACPAGAFTPDAACNSAHSVDVVSALCLGKQACNVKASCATFHENLKPPNAFCWDVKKRLDAKVTCGKKAGTPAQALIAADADAAAANATTHYWVDFGKEFQGGLVLTVGDGLAGQTVGLKVRSSFLLFARFFCSLSVLHLKCFFISFVTHHSFVRYPFFIYFI